MFQSNKMPGLKWYKCTDSFVFDFKYIVDKSIQPYTKQDRMHSIASIYDPLGIISPIVLRMKIPMQDICHEKVDWVDPLTGLLLPFSQI